MGDPQPSPPSYLSLVLPTDIRLDGSNSADETASPISVRLYMELEHYPGVVTWEESFTVWVHGCSGAEITPVHWNGAMTPYIQLFTSRGDMGNTGSPILAITLKSTAADRLTFNPFTTDYEAQTGDACPLSYYIHPKGTTDPPPSYLSLDVASYTITLQDTTGAIL